MTTDGYARVSTDGQTLAAQDAQLRAADCAQVYAEKISGAVSDRPELAKVLKLLSEGEVLVVTRLDRLARSTADTATPHGRLMLTVLGGLAEFERELIKARTGDGRERAQARGVRFGRPPKLNPHQRREALDRLRNIFRWYPDYGNISLLLRTLQA